MKMSLTMARLTLLFERLVNHHESAIFELQRKMAFFAQYFFMRALELERTVAIMHKCEFTPQRCVMTFFTTPLPFLAELVVMHVRVAIRATKSERPVADELRHRPC